MTIRIAIILLFLLTLGACAEDPIRAETKRKNEIVGSITYVRDKRTDLCFAVISSHSYAQYDIISFTNVPCDRVAQFLNK